MIMLTRNTHNVLSLYVMLLAIVSFTTARCQEVFLVKVRELLNYESAKFSYRLEFSYNYTVFYWR